MNACDPRECSCCASSRRFEPWLLWELRLSKFIIIIIIIIALAEVISECSWIIRLVVGHSRQACVDYRPDMTFAIDWGLKKQLSIYLSINSIAPHYVTSYSSTQKTTTTDRGLQEHDR